MALSITERLVLLCEGGADKAFFRALLRERPKMPRFNIPFPEPRDELDDGKEPLGGRDNIDRMLRDIRVPLGFRNVLGILIVVDSADDPNTTFDFVCGKIRQATGYTVPPTLLAPSNRTAASPQIAVMCMPDEENAGGVETLYAREIEGTRDWIANCVDAFLSCGQIDIQDWVAEKKSKARFHSMVAALYEHDPSRSSSMIWKRRGAPLLMDIKAKCFDNVEMKIRAFAAAVGA